MPSKSIDHAFTARQNLGAASDPTHAGALSFMRRRFTKKVAGADVVVWGIPFDAAVSNRPGARFGPQAIRRASAIFDNDPQYPFGADLFDKLSVVDYGDCLLDYGNHQKTPGIIEREAKKLLKSDAFLLSLGGDHFVTWPLLKAHAEKHGPLALVQFDAHQDTWPYEKGRIDHGAFVGQAADEGVIDVEKSIQIGIRTHAPRDCGIRMLFGHELEEMRAGEIAAAILEEADEIGMALGLSRVSEPREEFWRPGRLEPHRVIASAPIEGRRVMIEDGAPRSGILVRENRRRLRVGLGVFDERRRIEREKALLNSRRRWQERREILDFPAVGHQGDLVLTVEHHDRVVGVGEFEQAANGRIVG